jgi:uncharacterized repeat protein (TIGR03803 family)
MLLRKLWTTASLWLIVFAAATHMAAQEETILADFGTTTSAGQTPNGIVRDSAGNLYGTTYGGGLYGAGTVFKASPAGNGVWTTAYLYNFGSFAGDGVYPYAGLAMDSSGNLYGVTSQGGGKQCSDGYNNFGCGTVFELSPSGSSGEWTETILYDFRSNANNDGYNPVRGLVLDSAGNLYGTTLYGGSPDVSFGGTVFEVRRSAQGIWSERVLHRFGFGDDGVQPVGPLVLDKSGNLYGVTEDGGGANTFGTAFVLERTSSGWKENILFRFHSKRTGENPGSGLIFDSTGNLYGITAPLGIEQDLSGNVFELSPTPSGSWNETVLHSFGPNDPAGYNPETALTLDSAGNLYGTTAQGGERSWGTVFQLQRSDSGFWTETVLHSFPSYGTDGENPNSALVFDASGNLYGTTVYGGTGSGENGQNGTVFEIAP